MKRIGAVGIRASIARATGRARRAIVAPFAAVNDWQSEIPDEGRIVLAGLLLVGLGIALEALALAVPGGLLIVVGLGFNFRAPAAAVALIVVTGLAVVAAILVGGLT